ncbi:hypothetical protein [Streptomyces iconiensis]|uniref:Secreted protein n=1 Tax=Streptomyces iconiensis TaxID=1384038 RepID=A0ABT7A8M8_9ACTN|nr:hypothetical protein [Streptomyces iconiensis]MDJ1137703.1 hypothetical protein [Streptomyces iconiensis]
MRRRARLAALAAAAGAVVGVLGVPAVTAGTATAAQAPAPPGAQQFYCGYNDANYQPYWLSCSGQDREIKVRDSVQGEHTRCAPARRLTRIGDNVYQTTLAWETGRSCRA